MAMALDGQQLAHAGCDSDFLGIADVHQTRVVSADHRTVAGGGDGRHVHGMMHLGAAALNVPASVQPAGVAGHRGDAHEGRVRYPYGRVQVIGSGTQGATHKHPEIGESS